MTHFKITANKDQKLPNIALKLEQVATTKYKDHPLPQDLLTL